MLNGYLKRGLLAGAVGGLAYAAFVVVVGNSLVAHAEHYEHGHGGGHAHAAGGGSAVPAVVTDVTSAVAPVVVGAVLGLVVFGVAYYFLEPVLPGAGDTKSYVLGAVGFVTVSGAPWVLLPPQPPGVTQALPTDVRLTWYATMMAVGAAACGLSLYAYARLRSTSRPVALAGGLAPLAAIPLVALLAPANSVSGPVPAQFAAAFRAVVVFGQLGLWLVLASAHAWLVRRAADEPEYQPTDPEDAGFDVASD